MRFLYDVLHLVEHLSNLQQKYFQELMSASQEQIQENHASEAQVNDAPEHEVPAAQVSPLDLELPIDIQVLIRWSA